MYLATYKGTKSENFSTYETLEQAKERCMMPCLENPRTKGDYIIYSNVSVSCNDLIVINFKEKSYTGIKSGKVINWN